MNSEELEQSLRTEFETYLKGVVAEMRRDVEEFQKNIESEFEKHKSNLDESFREFASRLDSDRTFDEAFTESVVEHLRLARDEGAKITATAFAEAEKMQPAPAAPAAAGGYGALRDAIKDISSKNSQASILRSLVEHATAFTTRGAFFIVKNEKLVGWKVFGNETHADDDTARSVEFSVDSNTVLADAVSGLATSSAQFDGSSEDGVYLEPLGFGSPEMMYAVPLTARGRGVAVLYADAGSEGGNVDLEALESLVRVAGLTVELLASGHSVRPTESEQTKDAATPSQSFDEYSDASETAAAEQNGNDMPEVIYTDAEVTETEDIPEVQAEFVADPSFETADTGFEMTHRPGSDEAESEAEISAAAEPAPWNQPVAEQVEEADSYDAEPEAEIEYAAVAETSDEAEEEPVVEYSEPVEETSFATGTVEREDSFSTVEFESTRLEETEPAVAADTSSNGSAVPEPEPVVEVAGAQPTRTRLSDRNVDLPIEVADDERRLHNDARRFARLLVSEIKLYNEQKVSEGREAGDLYDRLREAIDRSREMYEKRVHPPVAAKFDYFHYELVNSLSEGDATRLGPSYPGASV